MIRIFSIFSIVTLLFSNAAKTKVDLIIHHAKIYTVDASFSIVEAMAITNGRIIATGKSADLLNEYEGKATINANNQPIFPGLIDAHTHFFNYGISLQQVDLTGTDSWEEVLQKCNAFASKLPAGNWLIGQGWDQNDWTLKEFPSNEQLNKLFPDRPVMLRRVDGHAVIVNQKALEMAGVKAGQKINGGDIETKNGQVTGILVDNAIGLVSSRIPAPGTAQLKDALLNAQRNCFAVGLTTVDDCGLNYDAVLFIDSLQKTRDLKMRIYAMLSDAKKNYDFAFSKGKIKTDYLHVCSFKVYADGALGSRGACLLQPYTDKPNWSGFLLSSAAHFDAVAKIIHEKGFQMCTHAIGDSGNRTILNIYAKYLNGKNDLRWRIEHAQVINENDFKIFGANSIVASVQPTHATSDMYWAADRLGSERVKDAYAFEQLLEQNGWIPLGTDFPVEDISPFKTFYAAVIRKDAKGFPDKGFQMENALSRENTLRGMTIWAAKSNFEENEKGSLEKSKFADFVILDQDLMTVTPDKILQTQVLNTFVNGEKVFEKNKPTQ